MKSLISKWNAMPRQARSLAVMAVATTGLLVTMGALNNGVAPTTGVWDGLVTYIKDMLSSTFVIMLALIALVICVWQIAHGRGYAQVATVIGLLAVALLGPNLVSAAATATRDPAAVVAFAPVSNVTTVALAAR